MKRGPDPAGLGQARDKLDAQVGPIVAAFQTKAADVEQAAASARWFVRACRFGPRRWRLDCGGLE